MVLVEFGPQGWLRLVNCGHPPPLLVQPTGRRLLEPRQPAPPLGLDPNPVVEQVRLGPEDRLLLYTDGLVEARAADRRQFELDERVEACLTAATLERALDGLVGLLLTHAGRRLDDDLALVLLAPAAAVPQITPPRCSTRLAAGRVSPSTWPVTRAPARAVEGLRYSWHHGLG